MIINRRSEQPRRRPIRIQSSGMGDVAALVIGAQNDIPAARLRAQGMAGMGDSLLDQLKAGVTQKTTEIGHKLDKVEILLKVTIGAALFSAAMSIVTATRRRA